MGKFNKKEISINSVNKKIFNSRLFKCKKCPIETRHKHVSKFVPVKGDRVAHYRRVNTIVML